MNQENGLRRIHVGSMDQMVAGACLQVEVDGRSLGLVQIEGEIRAVLNHCPHQGAPICRGVVRGTTLPSPPGTFQWGREEEILVCPWHGWEFSLKSGQCLTGRTRLAMFPTEVVNGEIFVLMRARGASARPFPRTTDRP